MGTTHPPDPIVDAERLFEGFEQLMPFQVQDILLVSSLYDAFTLQEDGRLNELILSEYLDLNLHHTPGITHVSSGAEALALAREQPRFNLIVTTIQTGDMDAVGLARAVRAAGPARAGRPQPLPEQGEHRRHLVYDGLRQSVHVPR